MTFFADYHTHTICSHGKNTIEENIKHAIECNLKQIAITDHSFTHYTCKIDLEDLHIIRFKIDYLNKKYKDKIKILLGCESNLITNEGDIDVDLAGQDYLDILLCGYHRIVKSSLKVKFNFFLPNLFSFTQTNKRIIQNTDCYIKALEKNKNIDILTHLNTYSKINVLEVAKACEQHNVYIELNGKRINFSQQDVENILSKTNAMFIVNSDAHCANNVGNFALPIEFIKKYNIPKDRIANCEKIPKFKKYNHE